MKPDDNSESRVDKKNIPMTNLSAKCHLSKMISNYGTTQGQVLRTCKSYREMRKIKNKVTSRKKVVRIEKKLNELNYCLSSQFIIFMGIEYVLQI